MSKEYKAKEYARNCYPYNGEMQFQCEYHYESGWDEALKSQWVKVDDKLPNDLEKVLLASLYEREILYSVGYMFNGKWVTSNNKPFAWMQIPSFDNILEYNKDTLK